MDPDANRLCRHCNADVPTQSLACPSCGRYYDGGFAFPELVDGVRAWPDAPVAVDEVTLEEAPSMLPGFLEGDGGDDAQGLWRNVPPSRPSRPPVAIGRGHEVHLPEVGPVTDLPYATDDETAEVIDLRDDRGTRAGRSLLGRLRARA
jgi:hypothetical protein